MPQHKFYVVIKGNKTGIFTSHKEWLDATRKFKHNHSMCFDTREEAEEYYRRNAPESENPISNSPTKGSTESGGNMAKNRSRGLLETAEQYQSVISGIPPSEQPIQKAKTKQKSEAIAAAVTPEPKLIQPKDTATSSGKNLPKETTVWERLALGDTVVFTDGTCNLAQPKYGCGIYIISPDGSTQTHALSGNDTRFVDESSTAGELLAVMQAFTFLMLTGVKKATVFHDFDGVYKLTKSSSKPKKAVTRYYNKFMRENILPNMEVSFVKVESHSGHRFNELVDRLAKHSLEWY